MAKRRVGRLESLEARPSPVEGQMLVLASGGIDSATLLALARVEKVPVSACFVDYGQASSKAEETAVTAICSHLKVCLQTVRFQGMRFGAGEIRGRNAFLLQTALMQFAGSSGTIMIAIHAGTGYRDCSPAFVELMQRSFEFHTGGSISVSAPFIDWPKVDVYRLARKLDVPLQLTFSCESSDAPCGTCASCRDRLALGLEV